MTNYNKIKACLDIGFRVQLFDKKDKDYAIAYSVSNSGGINTTTFFEDINNCYNGRVDGYWSEKDINELDLEITPIPHLYKEIKGKVDIIDCPEIRELAKRNSWSREYTELIGKKGLDIFKYNNDIYGQYYTFVQGFYVYRFPAWCVTPHIEEEKKETIKIGDKEYDKVEFENAVKDLKTIN